MEANYFYRVDQLMEKKSDGLLMSYLKQKDLSSFRLNPQIISAFEEKTGLFFNENTFDESSACYALSPEIRQDYKVDFSSSDLIDYSWAMMHFYLSSPTKVPDSLRIQFPVSSDSFWKISDIGAEIRKEYQKRPAEWNTLQTWKEIYRMISETSHQPGIKKLISQLHPYLSNSSENH